MAIDPVCKMEVEEGKAATTSEYKGKKCRLFTNAKVIARSASDEAIPYGSRLLRFARNNKQAVVKRPQKYCFCVLGCKKAFNQNPEKYLTEGKK